MNYPELEIGLSRCDAASYAVQVRFRDPDQEAEQRVDVKDPVRFDFEQLRELAVDPRATAGCWGRTCSGNRTCGHAWTRRGLWPRRASGGCDGGVRAIGWLSE